LRHFLHIAMPPDILLFFTRTLLAISPPPMLMPHCLSSPLSMFSRRFHAIASLIDCRRLAPIFSIHAVFSPADVFASAAAIFAAMLQLFIFARYAPRFRISLQAQRASCERCAARSCQRYASAARCTAALQRQRAARCCS